jgi:hypothetical protein
MEIKWNKKKKNAWEGKRKNEEKRHYDERTGEKEKQKEKLVENDRNRVRTEQNPAFKSTYIRSHQIWPAT